jgi:hypothetical protein
VDAAGNLFIADAFNYVIREVVESSATARALGAAVGTIITVAGNGKYGYSGDGGPATSAELLYPFGVAVDAAGNLFIADTENNLIREVVESSATARALGVAVGTIITVAGNGYGAGSGLGSYHGDGGPATSAELHSPTGVAVDAAGDLFIADTFNNVIREVLEATGTIITVAGTGGAGYSGDGGPATNAEFHYPSGVAVDTVGDVFIADTLNDVVREVKVLPAVVGVAAAPAPTTITLSASTTQAVYGQPVILTATVRVGGLSTATPTGAVTFFDNGTSLGTEPLIDGIATLPVTLSAVGQQNMTAIYNGNQDFEGSVEGGVTVSPAQTSTTVEFVTSTIFSGQFLIANVVADGFSTATPTGEVTFFDNGVSLGTEPLSDGIATLPEPLAASGAGTISVIYTPGNEDFLSSSAEVAIEVATLLAFDIGPATIAAVAIQPLGAGQAAPLQPLVEGGLALVATLTTVIPTPLAAPGSTAHSGSEDVSPGASGDGAPGQVPPAVLSPLARFLIGLDQAFEQARSETRLGPDASVRAEDTKPAEQGLAVFDDLLAFWSTVSDERGTPQAAPVRDLIQAGNPAAVAVDAALRDLGTEAGMRSRMRSITSAETSLLAVDESTVSAPQRLAEQSRADMLTALGVAALGLEVLALGLTGGVPPSRGRSAAPGRRRFRLTADPRHLGGRNPDHEPRRQDRGGPAVAREQTGDRDAEFPDEYGPRLERLSHQGLREVAALKLKGHTEEEIAKRLRSTRRSVQRKLALIRLEWRGAGI